MLRPSLLERERKSGAIRHRSFRQSPKDQAGFAASASLAGRPHLQRLVLAVLDTEGPILGLWCRIPLSQQQALTMTEDKTTHFGYKQVPVGEKGGLVRSVFDSVASRYDLMNDLMSFGIHRLWKRYTVELAGVRGGQRVLDLAGGTGDLAARFAGIVGSEGEVVLTDINAAMLARGRDRLIDEGIAGNVHFAQVDAERQPFPTDHFDCVTIGFGLRNVTHKQRALEEMFRVLRPGGRALVLEFSHPTSKPLSKAYDLYSFTVLPILGRLVADDSTSYRYLAESIRMHPDQDTLRAMMEQVGFERCTYFNVTGGIVAIHRGYKL